MNELQKDESFQIVPLMLENFELRHKVTQTHPVYFLQV